MKLDYVCNISKLYEAREVCLGIWNEAVSDLPIHIGHRRHFIISLDLSRIPRSSVSRKLFQNKFKYENNSV